MFKVLLVEDSIMDLNGIIKHIDWNKLSCEIISTATNGEQGVAKALEFLPDIVITDISMPSMNGIEMTKQILKKLPDVQFIFMTAFDDFCFAHEAIKLNVCDYVLKPISLKLMTEAIKKACSIIEGKHRDKQKEEQLSRLQSENIEAIKERLLVNVLTSKDNADLSFVGYLNMIPDTEYYFVILEIFDGGVPASIQQKFSRQIILKKHLQKSFDKYSGIIYASYGDSLIVMILPHTEAYRDSFTSELNGAAKEFRSITGNSLRVYIYDDTVNINELNEVFEFSYAAISSMIFEDEEDVITIDQSILGNSNNNKDSIASKIYNGIDKNFFRFDVVNEIISELGISNNYANILFKQKYNRTIFEFLVFKRIETAKKMLSDKNMHIYEIAQKVGYTSNTYFSTAFRQYTGLSPKEYRILNIKEDNSDENTKE